MQHLPVQYQDILDAVPRVNEVLSPTPLYEWKGLSDLIGCRFFLKHENHQPVGAFKVRGGINLIGTLSEEEKDRGIVGCSTGNHGQSLAFACKHFGVKCTIVVPDGNNPEKNRAIRNLGATLVEHGHDFDAARDYLERELIPQGFRYVHSANEPLLIAGVGTCALEIFHELPKPDSLFVPIGLGSGVAGACIVAKSLHPECKVIGVQAENAPSMVQSWREKSLCPTETAKTWAEGMATRTPAETTLQIMQELMNDALLVTEDELRRGAYSILKHTHNIAEGAGAAALAAAFKMRNQLQSKTVVGILSGGNLDLNELPAILEAGELKDRR